MRKAYTIVIEVDTDTGATASGVVLHALADAAAMIHANPDAAVNAATVGDDAFRLASPHYVLWLSRAE